MTIGRPRPGPTVDDLLAERPLWVDVVAVAATFLLAVRLLGAATRSLGPELSVLLRQLLVADGPALGVGWLAAYLLGNGSLVAAIAVSLFAAGVLSAPQLFLVVAGSRLGSAGVVLFVGGLDYLQERQLSLTKSLALGILTAVVTLSVTVPATVVGYLLLTDGLPLAGRSLRTAQPGGAVTVTAQPALDTTAAAAAFGVAVVLFVASLRLFDHVLDRLDTDRFRERYVGYLDDRWLAFGLGVVVTGVTTSVAVSLGAVVPLYNRDYLDRSQMTPYIMGANVGTFGDTLVVAALLERPDGVGLVALFVALTALTAVTFLGVFERYERAVGRLVALVYESPVTVALTLVTLVAVPLAFVVVPFVLVSVPLFARAAAVPPRR